MGIIMNGNQGECNSIMQILNILKKRKPLIIFPRNLKLIWEGRKALHFRDND